MKNQKKAKPLEIVLFAMVFVIFLFSLYQVITITLEYKAGRDEYKKLESFVHIEEEPLLDTEAVKKSSADKETATDKETETAHTSEEREIAVRYYDGMVNMNVDFASLKEMNSDFEAWLYVPAVAVSYPVVLGEDNEFYLTHTFQKMENKAGTIFLDQITENPFENYHTIIHGHNMKDGSMFGKLKNIYQSFETYAKNPYFYIYTPETTYKYLICSYYVTKATSDVYVIPNTEETYLELKNRILDNAVYKDVEGIPEQAPLVTLSTCYGTDYTEERLVIHGILVETQ